MEDLTNLSDYLTQAQRELSESLLTTSTQNDRKRMYNQRKREVEKGYQSSSPQYPSPEHLLQKQYTLPTSPQYTFIEDQPTFEEVNPPPVPKIKREKKRQVTTTSNVDTKDNTKDEIIPMNSTDGLKRKIENEECQDLKRKKIENEERQEPKRKKIENEEHQGTKRQKMTMITKRLKPDSEYLALVRVVNGIIVETLPHPDANFIKNGLDETNRHRTEIFFGINTDNDLDSNV